MSLTVSQGKGETVITFTSNPNSKWPILCQILGSLCSPVCAVSQHMKLKMMGVYTALGIVQLLVGLLSIVTGILISFYGLYHYNIVPSDAPFWLGGVFLAVGMVTVVAVQFPSSCLLLIAVVLNNVSTVLAVIGLAMYSCDLSSSLPYQMISGALDITMLIFFALQLCVTLSFSILICSKEETILCGKFVENPQFYKPLKEVTVSHVC
ncbi:membrane-spanning 4-domains subfamily A member 12-like [Labeo rohita]|uniref:membrane-spanning 4-domains subfamily A member 12-like n=1 Tax=Labeo rohita TaxID=84645 RepID=UPI0021E2EBF5|nr:membrane-spanning 4-domains subfamily A member 12-like [Labeo rohita]